MRLLSSIAVFFCAVVGAPGHAQPTNLSVPPASTTATHTRLDYWKELDRQAWRLSDEDWTRYQTIMRGPRGLWSPNLDPLTALMLEARTDDERSRYAELLAIQEEARARKELDAVRAYAAAWQKLYPNAKLFDLNALPGSDQQPAGQSPFQPGDRIAFFVELTCTACRTIIDQVLHHTNGLLYPGLDVYVIGATDQEIRAWAGVTNVPAQALKSGALTLNQDGGLLKQLQRGREEQFPIAYRRRGDEFVPIEMTALANASLYPARPATQQAQSTGFLQSVMGQVSRAFGGK